jgi:hypothetical protein
MGVKKLALIPYVFFATTKSRTFLISAWLPAEAPRKGLWALVLDRETNDHTGNDSIWCGDYLVPPLLC